MHLGKKTDIANRNQVIWRSSANRELTVKTFNGPKIENDPIK